MKSDKLYKYISTNAYAEKWWNDVNKIDNKIIECLKKEYTIYDLNSIIFDIEKLIVFAENIYENKYLPQWFQEFVESHATLLLWVIQESKKELNIKILDKYLLLESNTVCIFEDKYDCWLYENNDNKFLYS